jgi:hypothetical protein
MKRLGACSAALVLMASCLGMGCLSVGHEFPVEPVRKIEIGATTREDVRDMFGEPWRTGIEDGERTWTYGRYRYSLFAEAATRDLVVRFDARGVVTSYSFNSTHAKDAEL